MGSTKIFLKNTINLIIVRGVGVLSPLLLIPIYIKALGVETYGYFSLANGLALLSQVLIVYGFNYTATRELVETKDEIEKKTVIRHVRNAQLILLWTSLLLFSVTSILYMADTSFMILVVLLVLSQFYEIIFPQWLYHGLHEIPRLKNINICHKALVLTGGFTIIQFYPNIYIIPIIHITSTILCWLTFKIIEEKDGFQNYSKIHFRPIVFNQSLQFLKGSSNIFFSQLTGQLYVYMPKLLLGKYTSLENIAVFDIGEKLIRFMKTPNYILIQALFPIYKGIRSNKFKKLIPFTVNFFAIIVSITSIRYQELLFSYFGIVSNSTFNFFLYLSLSTIAVSISSFVGPLGLVIRGEDRFWLKSTISGVLIFFATNFIFILSERMNLINSAITILLSEIAVLITATFYYLNGIPKK